MMHINIMYEMLCQLWSQEYLCTHDASLELTVYNLVNIIEDYKI